MFRLVPPAGTAVKVSQVLRALKAACTSNGRSERTLKALGEQVHVPHVFALSSGRAALWAILKALHHLRPERDVVAVPAYTCFSVPASIVRAGLRVFPVDVDPETLDFDFAQLALLPEKQLLCIVTSHLFGLVNDVSRIRQIARAKGAFVVDDAAQALGASREGRLAGTCGDVGFYSLGRGKPLACAEGGLIVTDSEEIASALQVEAEVLPPSPLPHSAWVFLQTLAYSLFLHPRLYWIPHSLPFLKLGTTEYDPGFPITALARFPAAFLSLQMDRLSELNEIRRKNGTAISRALAGNPHFAAPRPADGCLPTYIRFPVMAQDGPTRDRAVARLRAACISASPFYPGAVCDIETIGRHMAIRDFHRPKAEEVSRRLLTLPTHEYVTDQDLETIVNTLRSVPEE